MAGCGHGVNRLLPDGCSVWMWRIAVQWCRQRQSCPEPDFLWNSVTDWCADQVLFRIAQFGGIKRNRGNAEKQQHGSADPNYRNDPGGISVRKLHRGFVHGQYNYECHDHRFYRKRDEECCNYALSCNCIVERCLVRCEHPNGADYGSLLGVPERNGHQSDGGDTQEQ